MAASATWITHFHTHWLVRLGHIETEHHSVLIPMQPSAMYEKNENYRAPIYILQYRPWLQ